MKVLVIVLLFLGSASFSFASDEKGLKTENLQIIKSGRQVDVHFRLLIGKKATRQNYKLIVTPVLSNGTNEMRLKQIVIETRTTKIVDDRQQMTYGKNNIIKENGYMTRNGESVDYSLSFPFEEWMNGASFRLDRLSCGCCREEFLAPELVSSDLRLVKELIPTIEERTAIVPQIKRIPRKYEFSKEEMIIDFIVDKTKINFSLFNNRETLEEIVNAVNRLRNNPQNTISKIEIEGYASPEGKMNRNSDLAISRAKALKDYLQRQISELPDSLFEVKNGGENWKGLRKMVAISDMPDKEAVLYIIDHIPAEINYTTNDSRKKRLMNLKGGIPYNYMLKEFFPLLRNACYIGVYYDSFEDKEGEVINEGIGLIKNKNYETALEKLLPVKDDKRAWNAIGVCYMMTGQFNLARSYLEMAEKEGSIMAKKNLGQITEYDD